MKLDVENVAKVSRAEVLLEGMTVIAGENGTGKSTVSRALMAIASMSANMKPLSDSERAASLLRDAMNPVLMAEGAQVMLRDPLGASRLDHLLDPSLWKDSSRVRAFLRSVFRQQEQSLFIYPENALKPEGLDRIADEVAKKALRILEIPEADYVRYVLEKNMPSAFMGAMAHADGKSPDMRLALVNERFKISVGFLNGKVSAFDGWGAKPFQSIFYSEPKNKLDDVDEFAHGRWPRGDRYSTNRSLAAQILREVPQSESLVESAEYEQTMELVSQLVNRLHGRLKSKDSKFTFHEQFSSGAYSVPLLSMASGVKTMATIIRLLENKTILPGGLVIIDEPESNLHPEYQILFAEFLVRLCDERNIKLLVNTHSPYFLRALQKFSSSRAVRERCHYYMMKPDESEIAEDVSSRTFHAELKDCNVEEVYSSLARPLEVVL